MERVNPEAPPKPCDYFDMICGTSTGGLIAIMLGRLEMDISECLAAYETISQAAFTKKHFSPINYRGHIRTRFDTAALEAGIKSVIQARGLDPDKALLRNPDGKCKTFVCATSKENRDTVILSSYYSPRSSMQLYHNTLIWQAARATAAATTFFDDIEFCDTTFVDGATGANNPVCKLWTEAGDHWVRALTPRLEDQIESLISIGTGVPSVKPFGDDLVAVGKTLKDLALETERTAEQFQRDRAELDDSKQLFRFNVTHGLENIGLEDAAKRKEIVTVTRSYLAQQTIYRNLDVCAATLGQRHIVSQVKSLFAHAVKVLDPLFEGPSPMQEVMNTTREDAQWLEHTPEYQDWLSGDASRYLALLAEAGFGKTRFLRYTIRSLANKTDSDLHTLITYIPCQTVKDLMYLPSQLPRRKKTGLVSSTLRNVSAVEEALNDDDYAEAYDDQERLSIHIPDLSTNTTLKTQTETVDYNSPTSSRGVASPAVRSGSGADVAKSGHNVRRLSHVAIFRMIIIEMLHQRGHGMEYLKKTMDNHRNCLQLSSLQDFLRRDDQVAADFLVQLTQIIVCDLQVQTVILIIDELEQLMHHHQLELVKMLDRLSIPQYQSRTVFRVLIAGRPEVNLSHRLNRYLMINSQAELDACLQSLRFKEMYARRDRVASSSKGTNLWIWNHKAFRDWMDASNGILWIEGKAGCGKSTLAKEIQNRLHLVNSKLPAAVPKATITGFQSPLVTDHFYSARQSETGVSHELMLRSIIYQILKSDQTLFHALQPYSRRIQSELVKINGQWSWDQLAQCLRILKQAKGPKRKLICIIDAMDESKQDDINERQRTRVLRLLQSLCTTSKAEETAEMSGLTFKFIVLSRPAREISRELQKCHRILMHAENSGDIRLLIEQGLRDLQKLIKQDDMDDEMYGSSSGCDSELDRNHRNAELAEQEAIKNIRTHLTERASGVTLWVLLVLGQLRKLVFRGFFSFPQLFEELKKLPEHRLQLYQNISSDLAQKLEPAELSRARSLLLWISFASRPLTLTELWEAATLPLSRHVSDFDQLVNMRVHRRDSHQIWLGMIELCGPFIDLVHDNTLSRHVRWSSGPTAQGTDTVQLLHQSVKEFLVKQEAGAFRILPGDVVKLTHACLVYASITFPIQGLPPSVQDERWNEQDHRRFVLGLDDRPLLLYAVQNARYDSAKADDKALSMSVFNEPQFISLFGIGVETSSQKLKKRKRARVEAFQWYRTCWFVLGCKLKAESAVRLLLYSLRWRGYVELGEETLTILLQAVKDSDYRTVELIRKHPMFASDLCQSSFTESTCSLLKDPLLAAIQKNDLRMVKQLIEGLRGRLSVPGYPVHFAAAHAGVEVMEYVALKAVAIDTLDHSMQAPMDIVLRRNYIPLIKLLRSMGAKTASEQRVARIAFDELEEWRRKIETPGFHLEAGSQYVSMSGENKQTASGNLAPKNRLTALKVSKLPTILLEEEVNHDHSGSLTSILEDDRLRIRDDSDSENDKT